MRAIGPNFANVTHPDVFGVRRAPRVVGKARGLATDHAERLAVEHLERTGGRTSAVLTGLDCLNLPDYEDIA